MTLKDISSGPDWILWAVFGLLAIISIIFLTGHGEELIAGYNTASKEEQEKYNTKKMCRVMGIGMSVITILLGIMAIGKTVLPNYFVFIFVGLVLIDVVIMIVLVNKLCKEKE
ncbi:MAG: DUF3784 domain-containing protein [Treponema sp.]|nr:DUF3784 domain-containing protein [Treponema sp.]